MKKHFHISRFLKLHRTIGLTLLALIIGLVIGCSSHKGGGKGGDGGSESSQATGTTITIHNNLKTDLTNCTLDGKPIDDLAGGRIGAGETVTLTIDIVADGASLVCSSADNQTYTQPVTLSKDNQPEFTFDTKSEHKAVDVAERNNAENITIKNELKVDLGSCILNGTELIPDKLVQGGTSEVAVSKLSVNYASAICTDGVSAYVLIGEEVNGHKVFTLNSTTPHRELVVGNLAAEEVIVPPIPVQGRTPDQVYQVIAPKIDKTIVNIQNNLSTSLTSCTLNGQTFDGLDLLSAGKSADIVIPSTTEDNASLVCTDGKGYYSLNTSNVAAGYVVKFALDTKTSHTINVQNDLQESITACKVGDENLTMSEISTGGHQTIIVPSFVANYTPIVCSTASGNYTLAYGNATIDSTGSQPIFTFNENTPHTEFVTVRNSLGVNLESCNYNDVDVKLTSDVLISGSQEDILLPAVKDNNDVMTCTQGVDIYTLTYTGNKENGKPVFVFDKNTPRAAIADVINILEIHNSLATDLSSCKLGGKDVVDSIKAGETAEVAFAALSNENVSLVCADSHGAYSIPYSVSTITGNQVEFTFDSSTLHTIGLKNDLTDKLTSCTLGEQALTLSGNALEAGESEDVVLPAGASGALVCSNGKGVYTIAYGNANIGTTGFTFNGSTPHTIAIHNSLQGVTLTSCTLNGVDAGVATPILTGDTVNVNVTGTLNTVSCTDGHGQYEVSLVNKDINGLPVVEIDDHANHYVELHNGLSTSLTSCSIGDAPAVTNVQAGSDFRVAVPSSVSADAVITCLGTNGKYTLNYTDTTSTTKQVIDASKLHTVPVVVENPLSVPLNNCTLNNVTVNVNGGVSSKGEKELVAPEVNVGDSMYCSENATPEIRNVGGVPELYMNNYKLTYYGKKRNEHPLFELNTTDVAGATTDPTTGKLADVKPVEQHVGGATVVYITNNLESKADITYCYVGFEEHPIAEVHVLIKPNTNHVQTPIVLPPDLPENMRSNCVDTEGREHTFDYTPHTFNSVEWL